MNATGMTGGALYRKPPVLVPFGLDTLLDEILTLGATVALGVVLAAALLFWVAVYALLAKAPPPNSDKRYLTIFSVFFGLLGVVSEVCFMVSLTGVMGAGEMFRDFETRDFSSCGSELPGGRLEEQDHELHLFYTGAVGSLVTSLIGGPVFWFICVAIFVPEKFSAQKKKVVAIGFVVLSPLGLLIGLYCNAVGHAFRAVLEVKAMQTDAGCTEIMLEHSPSDVFTPVRLVGWALCLLVGFTMLSFGIFGVNSLFLRSGLYAFLQRSCCCSSQSKKDDEDDDREVELPPRRSRCASFRRRCLRCIGRFVRLPRLVNLEARVYGYIDNLLARWQEWMGKQIEKQFLGEDAGSSSSGSSVGSDDSDDELVSTALFRPRAGQRVRAFWDKKNGWYVARIRNATSRGCDVVYLKRSGCGELEEVGRETGVKIECIRRLHRFRRGEKVRCNVKNPKKDILEKLQGGTWRPGEIANLNKDGTYLVQIEGKHEDFVEEMRLEPIAAGSEGFNQTVNSNIFDFGFGELPGGIVARGGDAELVTGRLGSTSLVVPRDASLTVPLQDLHPVQGETTINSYTVMMDLKLPEVPATVEFPLVRTGADGMVLKALCASSARTDGDSREREVGPADHGPAPAGAEDGAGRGPGDPLPGIPAREEGAFRSESEPSEPGSHQDAGERGALLFDEEPRRREEDRVAPAGMGVQLLVGSGQGANTSTDGEQAKVNLEEESRSTPKRTPRPPTAAVQKWQHIAVTVDGVKGVAQIFVNGKPGATVPARPAGGGGKRGSSLDGGFPLAVDPSLPLIVLGGRAGPAVLRRFEFHNCVLAVAEVERRYVESNRIRKQRQPQKHWALADLWKRARPAYREAGFLAECLDPYLSLGDGGSDFWRAARLFTHTLRELSARSGSDEVEADVDVPPAVLNPFSRLVDLARYAAPLATRDQSIRMGALPRFLVQLGKQRARVTGGEPFLCPLVLMEETGPEAALLILQRMGMGVPTLGGFYRVVVCCAGPAEATRYHQHAFDPKLRVKTAMVLEGVPASAVEDDAWWFTMYAALLSSPRSGAHLLFDVFLPALIGEPVEGRLVQHPAAGDWRSRGFGKDPWRCLTSALRWVARQHGLSLAEVKLLRWRVRHQMLRFAVADLRTADGVDPSDACVVRLAAGQLGHAAVRHHGVACGGGPQRGGGHQQHLSNVALLHLRLAEAAADEIEEVLRSKPGKAEVLPSLCLESWGDPKPRCRHPIFDRLQRREPDLGDPDPLPGLLPVNFLEMPERVSTLGDVFECLRRCEDICSRLANLHFAGKCKFGPFLCTALLEQVLTQMLPLPQGPRAAVHDSVWSPAGFDGTHTALTRSGQLDMLLLLGRLGEHLFAATCSLNVPREFDGVQCILSGVLAMLADRLVRIRVLHTDTPAIDEPMESELTKVLRNGGFAVNCKAFLLQSETVELHAPALTVARTAILNYFCDVWETLQPGPRHTIFDWDQHSWMLWVKREVGTLLLVSQLARVRHYVEQPAALLAGVDPFAVHSWPDLKVYRDLVFLWKYFCCPDRAVFPKARLDNAYQPLEAVLKWSVLPENQAFRSPPNRGPVFVVSALGKQHLLTTGCGTNRPEPPASGHRWPSEASPAVHTSPDRVTCEDDLLYLRCLPSFDNMLSQADSELLLSYLTVPLLRQPLILSFFCSRDRVSLLRSEALQRIFSAALFEPGRLLLTPDSERCPSHVPAALGEEKLLATCQGLLLAELSSQPAGMMGYVKNLLELSLVQDVGATSEMAAVIRFAARTAARVESHALWLLQSGAAQGDDVDAAELRHGCAELQRSFLSTLARFDAWVAELLAAAKEDPSLEDTNVRQCCNIHAHCLLLLRNMGCEGGLPLSADTVRRVLSGMVFLTLRHTWNSLLLEVPETELFAVWQLHRRRVVHWLHAARARPSDLNGALRSVHGAVAQLEGVAIHSDVDALCWAAVAGGVPGTYVAVARGITAPPESAAEAAEVSAQEAGLGIEIDVQQLQLVVHGQHLQPLEAGILANSDYQTILDDAYQAQAGDGQEGGKGKKGSDAPRVVQSSIVLNESKVRVHELVSRPFRLACWKPFAGLPALGDRYDRGYDPEELEEEEAWILPLFEPIRQRFFVAPACGEQDIQFFLLPTTRERGTFACLAGMHPKLPGRVWKEVVLFRCWGVAHVYSIIGHAQQLYRFLEYTTDCRLCYHSLQPSTSDRVFPLPHWAEREAGGIAMEPSQDHAACVAISRIYVLSEQCGAEARREVLRQEEVGLEEEEEEEEEPPDVFATIAPSEQKVVPKRRRRLRREMKIKTKKPDDASDSGSSAESSQDSSEESFGSDEGEDGEGGGGRSRESGLSAYRRRSKEGEQYLPPRLLLGLLPDALLEQYVFFQDNRRHKLLRGYVLDNHSKAEDEDAVLAAAGPSSSAAAETGEEGRRSRPWLQVELTGRWGPGTTAATVLRQPSLLPHDAAAAADGETMALLNLLYAEEGTPPFELARQLSRIEDLSHILAWTSVREMHEPQPSIERVELPRLQLTFQRRRGPDGEFRLCCLDYAGLFVPCGTPSPQLRSAVGLMKGVPHGLFLSNQESELFCLVPFVCPHRPRVGVMPFGTQLVFSRGIHSRWTSSTTTRHFLFQVHPSLTLVKPPTPVSALYLLWLRLAARDYAAAFELATAINASGATMVEDERLIFLHLASLHDSHPDAHAVRVKILLSSTEHLLPFDLSSETAHYVLKREHVSARCRLTEEEERTSLQRCEEHRKRLAVVQNEVQTLQKKPHFEMFCKLLSDDRAMLETTQQERKAFDEWIERIAAQLRALAVPALAETIKSLVADVLSGQTLHPLLAVVLENRRQYVANETPVPLRIPARPHEKQWILHNDRNALICSEGDLQVGVLGHRAAATNTRNVLNSSGPELPDRFISVQDALRVIPVFSAGQVDLQSPQLFLKLYSLFTRTTRLRLRRKATQQQQHTFARLLLALHPGSQTHGVLTSLLHILANNPQICPDMPKLTWPRRVRRVRHWKRLLTQVHDQVKVYEERRQLTWPKTESPKLPLWTPPVTRHPALPSRGALCPMVFGLPGEVACPGPRDRRCGVRMLKPTRIMECSETVLRTLASRPLADATGGMVEQAAPVLPPDVLPFELTQHPGMRHPLAQNTMARLRADARNYAAMRRDGHNPQLRGFQQADIAAIAERPERRAAAAAQLSHLIQELGRSKAADEDFVVRGIGDATAVANASHGGGEEVEFLKFRLLRRCGLELWIGFEDLCRLLLSGASAQEAHRLAPFAGAAALEDAQHLATLVMLHCCRVQQTNVVLELLRDLRTVLLGHITPRPASLLQQAERVAADLDAMRSYIRPDRSFDPRLLHFEFVDRKLLRPRQVELVQSFLEGVANGQSAVQQMIMGNGKTTVVSPLLAFILADGSRLVSLLVPPSLLSFSRSVISGAFHGATMLRCTPLLCDRARILDVQLATRLQRAKELGEVLVTCPGDVKALILRLVENLLLAGDSRAVHSRGLGSETMMVGASLNLLRSSVCLIDEVDLVLHPLRSELNFPVGPKELLPFHPHRWRLPLHLLSCINQEDVPGILQESAAARAAFGAVRGAINRGLTSKQMQRWPHLVLLSAEFYHKELKGPIAEWLLTWFLTERVGQGSEVDGGVGMSPDALRAHLLSPTPRDPIARGRDGMMLNLGREWLQMLLPHCLSKIDRVTFGIMSDAQAAAQPPLCAATRKRLAIPFVGKDTPSPSSEYAHPDVLIGLTALAFHYEGLRRSDFDEALGRLLMEFQGEGGDIFERPSARRWKEWVEAAGGTVCLRQRELQDGPAAPGSHAADGQAKVAGPDVEQTRVLPLHLLERGNESQMSIVFHLLRRLPQLVDWYLDGTVFPTFLRFQGAKLTASGQDIGGALLFKQRIGFSGTPSELLPQELGVCQYERGSEGEVIATLSCPDVVAHQLLPEWTARSLLDEVCRGEFHALIDAGALITGLSNLQVAEYLLGLDGGPPHPVLRSDVEGLVFLDEESQKQILLRSSRTVQLLTDCGLPVERRFAFYDHVHTTGTDIRHRADAVAVLTLGKDMTLRDYSQSAYRMRGIGKGQRLHLFIIPEVHELVIRQASAGDGVPRVRTTGQKLAANERAMLRDVLAWLVSNTFMTERLQHGMLQLQNASNVWRCAAFGRLLAGYNAPTADAVMEAVAVFRDRVDFSIHDGLPPQKDIVATIEAGMAQHRRFITAEGEAAVRHVCELLQGLNKSGHRSVHLDAEQEQEQEQEQEREQEREKEQEVELENYVDLCHCREEDSPEPWPLVSLRHGGGGPGKEAEGSSFYPAANFRVGNQRPLGALPANMLVSDNHFNRRWSALRRPKNVIFALEWVASKNSVRPPVELVKSTSHGRLEDVEDARALDIVFNDMWELAMGQEAIAMPQEFAAELLNLMYDLPEPWEASATAILLGLGSRTTALPKHSLRTLLLHRHFRAVEQERRFVLLSLAEAETLRRILRCSKQLTATLPQTALALRCVAASFAAVDATQSFPEAPAFQAEQAHQLLRFLDGQSFYRAREVPFLIRALQRERCMARRLFFEGVAGLRRRPEAAGWREQPVSRAFALKSEFEWLLNRMRAAWIGGSLRRLGISSERCFEIADRQRVGRLELLEVLQLLWMLGLRALGPEGALDWLEAMSNGAVGLVVSAEAYRDFVHSGSGLSLATEVGMMAPLTASGAPDADPATALKCQQVGATRLARRRREEAEAQSLASAAREEVEHKLEEEQGANPLYTGQVYGLWDFRRVRLPTGSLAFGHVVAVPDGGDGQHFLQVEPQSFMVCPADALLSDILDTYSVTLWFRLPSLPSSEHDACILDTRRSDGGRLVVSKDGFIYPTGHRRFQAASPDLSSGSRCIAGVWSFSFDGCAEDSRVMLRVSTDEAGRVVGGPLSALHAVSHMLREKDESADTCFYQSTRLLRAFPVATECTEGSPHFVLSCELRVPGGSKQGWAGILCKQRQVANVGGGSPPASDQKPDQAASGEGNCRSGFCLGFNGDDPGTLRFDVGARKNDVVTLRNRQRVDDGKWHTIEARVDRTHLYLSVDGHEATLQPNESKEGALSSEAVGIALMIGNDPFGANRKLEGELKGIRLRSLTRRESSGHEGGRRGARQRVAGAGVGALEGGAGVSELLSSNKQRLEGHLAGDSLQLRLGEGQHARSLTASWDGSDRLSGSWATWSGIAGGSFVARQHHEEDVAGTWRLEQRSPTTGLWEPIGMLYLCCFPDGEATRLSGMVTPGSISGGFSGLLDGRLLGSDLELRWTAGGSGGNGKLGAASPWPGCSQLTGSIISDTLLEGRGRLDRGTAAGMEAVVAWRATRTPEHSLTKVVVPDNQEVHWHAGSGLMGAPPKAFVTSTLELEVTEGVWLWEMTIVDSDSGCSFGWRRKTQRQVRNEVVCPSGHRSVARRNVGSLPNKVAFKGCMRCQTQPGSNAVIWYCTRCSWVSCLPCAGGPLDCKQGHGLTPRSGLPRIQARINMKHPGGRNKRRHNIASNGRCMNCEREDDGSDSLPWYSCQSCDYPVCGTCWVEGARRAATRRALDSWTVDCERCRPGDTYGAELDFMARQVIFYHNGGCIKTLSLSDLPRGADLVPVAMLGPGSRVIANTGHRPFSHATASRLARGAGEALQVRPHWRVVLPEDIELLAAYAEPDSDSRGRPGLKAGQVVEEFDRSGDGWLLCEAGWVRTECLQAAPLFAGGSSGQSAPSTVKTRQGGSDDSQKCLPLVVLSTGLPCQGPVEVGMSLDGGPIDGLAVGSEPLSESAVDVTFTILRITDDEEYGEEASGFVGFASSPSPLSSGRLELEDNDWDFDMELCGRRSPPRRKKKGSRGASCFPPSWNADELVAVVGSSGDVYSRGQYVGQGPSLNVGDEVRLVCQDNSLRCTVNGSAMQNVQINDLGTGPFYPLVACVSGVMEVSATRDGHSAGFAEAADLRPRVVAGRWHVLTASCDAARSSLDLWLDGERHGWFELPGGQTMAIEPSLGLGIFGPRAQQGSRVADLLGGQVRSLEVAVREASATEVWESHAAKGVWRCREPACGRATGGPPRRNSAEALECVVCGAARPKSQQRPLGDRDPQHEGVVVVTLDSFEELVMRSSKSVLLLVHTDWCGACHAIWPLWSGLATLLEGSSVIVASADIGENDLPTRIFSETYVPVIKLFRRPRPAAADAASAPAADDGGASSSAEPASASSAPANAPAPRAAAPAATAAEPEVVQYQGPPELSHLLAFIAQHTDLSIPNACEQAYVRYREAHGVDALMRRIERHAASWRFSLDDDDPLRSLCRAVYAQLLEDDGEELPGSTTVQLRSAAAPSPPLHSLLPPSLVEAARAVLGIDGAGQSQLPAPPASAGDPVGISSRLMQLLEGQLMVAQPERPLFFVRDHVLLALCCPRFDEQSRRPCRSPAGRRIVALCYAGIFAARLRLHAGGRFALGHLASNAGLRRQLVLLHTALQRHQGAAVLEALLTQGLPVEGLAGEHEAPPLWLAAAAGDLPAVRLLLACKANAHRSHAPASPQAATQPAALRQAQGAFGSLPIEVAAAGGHANVVRLLLRCGSVPGAAVHHAVWAGSAVVVATLLELGCSPSARAHGTAPLAVATLAGSAPCVRLLLLAHCDPAALLPDGACLTAGLALGSSLLHAAAALGHGDICAELLGAPAGTSLLQATNAAGQRAEDVAQLKLWGQLSATRGTMWRAIVHRPPNTPIFKAIAPSLQQGVDPNEEEGHGWTALTVACACGDTAAIEALLLAGARPSSGSGYVWSHFSGTPDAAAQMLAAGHIETAEDRIALGHLQDAQVVPGKAERAAKGSKQGPSGQPWVPPPGALPEAFREESGTMSWCSLGSCMRAGLVHTEADDDDTLVVAESTQAVLRRVDGALGRGSDRSALSECTARTLQLIMGGSKLPPEALFAVAASLEEPIFRALCSAPRGALAERLHAAVRELPAMRNGGTLFRGVALGPQVGLPDFLRGTNTGSGQPLVSGTLLGSSLARQRYEPGLLVRWTAPALFTQDPRAAVAAMRALQPAQDLAGPAASAAADGRSAGTGRVLIAVRRCRSARDVTAFSPRLQLHAREVLLPPALLRVVALRPLTPADLAPHGLRPSWLPAPAPLSAASLSIDEACSLREVLVVLDEEDDGADGSGEVQFS